MVRRACWCVLAAVALQGLRASGEELPPKAAAAVERAQAAVERKEWALAAKFLTEAHQAAPTAPGVLFNLGAVHDSAGERDVVAIAWYRAYLAAAPGAANAAQVRQRVVGLEVAAEARTLRLVEAAKKGAAALPDPPRARAVPWPLLARPLVTSGNVELARRLAGQAPTPWKRDETLFHVAWQQARTGDAAGAEATARQILDDHWRDYALYELAAARSAAGDAARGRQTAERIRDESARRRVLQQADDYEKCPQPEPDASDWYVAASEIAAWSKMAADMTRDPVLGDFAGHLEAIQRRQPQEMVEGLTGAAETLAQASRSLRKVEAEWAPRRAGGEREPRGGTVEAMGDLTIFVFLSHCPYWVYVDGKIVARGQPKADGPTAVQTPDGTTWMDDKGVLARVRGGRVVSVREGEAEKAREVFHVDVPSGPHAVELAVASGDVDGAARQKDFAFTFRSGRMRVSIVRGDSRVLLVPPKAGVAAIAARAAIFLRDREHARAWLDGYERGLEAARERYHTDPVVLALSAARRAVAAAPPRRPAVVLDLPQKLGGRREFDADQIAVLVRNLEEKWWDHYAKPGILSLSVLDDEQRIRFEQLRRRAVSYRGAVARLGDIAKSLRQVKQGARR